jgi:hypothetical protein
MRVERNGVTREEVIRRYAVYDRRKKGLPPILDMDGWRWDDPDEIDKKLHACGLKCGVLAAYRDWACVEFGVADLLECAVVNHIFPGEPRALGQLALRGKLATWVPIGHPEWWGPIRNGASLDVSSALIARPALKSESPARWYLEDGSGRSIALLQRILWYGEAERIAWAYVGQQPDERSAFILSHPELMANGKLL